MTISENGLNFIKFFEGCVLHAYLDSASIPTIGWGSICCTDGSPIKMGDVITQDEADMLLTSQVNMKANQIAPMITAMINQYQKDAVIDFAYNVGTGAFHGSTLLKRINANPSDPNITPAFLMWTKIHKDGQLMISDGLVARRRAEATLYFT